MLRAFEAVAYHGSVTQAADELSVTHGAVSHQVKALEAHLAVKLLERQGRRVVLTEAGRAYAPELRAALDRMALATEQITRQHPHPTLTINVTSTFAARWLIPRLGSFCGEHPGIDVRVATAGDALDFNPHAFDATIRCLDPAALQKLRRRGDWEGAEAHAFLEETKFPVCSPDLLRGKPPRKPADLRTHTLLHSRSTPGAWSDWLATARTKDIDASAGLTFDNLHFSLQAASRGLGIAIGTLPMAQEELETGALVAPFPGIESDPKRYYLICAGEAANKPEMASFRGWLLAAAARRGTPPTDGPPKKKPRTSGA